ncbi:MAG: hypothetical protein WCK66_04560 [Betaproteobacteria bacterium]
MKKITYFLTCVLSFAPFCTNADTIKVLTTGAYKQMVLAMALSDVSVCETNRGT